MYMHDAKITQYIYTHTYTQKHMRANIPNTNGLPFIRCQSEWAKMVDEGRSSMHRTWQSIAEILLGKRAMIIKGIKIIKFKL